MSLSETQTLIRIEMNNYILICKLSVTMTEQKCILCFRWTLIFRVVKQRFEGKINPNIQDNL